MDTQEVTKEELIEQEKPSQKWLKKMKERKPDLDENDPEAIYGALDEYDGENSGRLKKYEDSDTKLKDLFMKNPELAGVFSDISEGSNPAAAFVKHFGETILGAKDDPEMEKQFIEAQQAYMDKISSSKQVEEEQKANWAKSIDEISAFVQSEGMGDDDGEAFLNKIITMVDNVFLGKLDQATLKEAYYGQNYEKDIKDAIETGKVEGKNETIRTKTKKDVGDGLPVINSAPAVETKKGFAPRRKNMFEIG